jgi:hypothetical protein
MITGVTRHKKSSGLHSHEDNDNLIELTAGLATKELMIRVRHASPGPPFVQGEVHQNGTARRLTSSTVNPARPPRKLTGEAGVRYRPSGPTALPYVVIVQPGRIHPTRTPAENAPPPSPALSPLRGSSRRWSRGLVILRIRGLIQSSVNYLDW